MKKRKGVLYVGGGSVAFHRSLLDWSLWQSLNETQENLSLLMSLQNTEAYLPLYKNGIFGIAIYASQRKNSYSVLLALYMHFFNILLK